MWNKAESSVAPDLTWTSFVYTISAADGQIFREIDALVLQDGKSSTEKLNAPNDGLYHAVAGSSSHEKDRVTQNTDGSIRIETKDDFGSRIMLCSLSDHFGRMTCLSQETFKGKEETETYIFHRK